MQITHMVKKSDYIDTRPQTFPYQQKHSHTQY